MHCRHAFAAAGIAALAWTGVVVVQAPTASAGGGFYTERGRHWYNHCGSGNVRIKIHWANIGPDRHETRCVGPGETEIGVPNEFQRIDWANAEGAC